MLFSIVRERLNEIRRVTTAVAVDAPRQQMNEAWPDKRLHVECQPSASHIGL